MWNVVGLCCLCFVCWCIVKCVMMMKIYMIIMNVLLFFVSIRNRLLLFMK